MGDRCVHGMHIDLNCENCLFEEIETLEDQCGEVVTLGLEFRDKNVDYFIDPGPTWDAWESLLNAIYKLDELVAPR